MGEHPCEFWISLRDPALITTDDDAHAVLEQNAEDAEERIERGEETAEIMALFMERRLPLAAFYIRNSPI